MNLPDVTLFFQMLHFIIAYTILRKFVFAPALTLIEQDEQHKNKLLKNVDTALTEQKELIVTQRQRWQTMQQALISMIPRFTIKDNVDGLQASAPVELADVTLSQQQKLNIKKMLYDKLSDVE